LALLEGETSTKVFSEERLFPDNGEKRSIHLLLECDSDLRQSTFLVPLAGKGVHSVLGNLGLASSQSVVGLLEETIVKLLGNLELLWQLHLGGGGNDVSLVDTTKRNSIDFVWASDKKKTGSQLLQEDNSVSTETSGKQDQNGSGSDLALQLGCSSFSLGRRKRATDWLFRVVPGSLSCDGSLLIFAKRLNLWLLLGGLLDGFWLCEVLYVLEVVCPLVLEVGLLRP